MKRFVLLGLSLAMFAAARAPAQTVLYNDLSLSYPAYLANAVHIVTVPATPNQPDTPPGDETPAYTLFDFVDYYPDDAPEIDLCAPFNAAIRVYDTSRFSDYNISKDGTVGFGAERRKLGELLTARPDLASPETLPFLPFVNAGQRIVANASYLEFTGGAGVRYLTAFGQEVAPLSEKDLFYTFQGLSDDGRYYLSATFPFDSGVLPDDALAGDFDYDAFLTQADVYFAGLVQQLANLPEAAPSLSDLDAVITPLNVTMPLPDETP